MALIDPNPNGQSESHLAFDSARLPKLSRDSFFPALARLAELHDEACQTWRQSQLLDRSPQASLALMLLGGQSVPRIGRKSQYCWSAIRLSQRTNPATSGKVGVAN